MFLAYPVVVGVRFKGELPTGSTATDLVLTLTEMLRKHGVVNKFVEFCGSGLSSLTVPDRATLSNMCPEYGATSALFPVDEQTLRYLRDTGREPEHVALVERYSKAQGMFRTDESETPVFSELLELDLARVEPSLAGPKRPQDRVPLPAVWTSFTKTFGEPGPTEIGRFNNEGGGQTAIQGTGSTAAATLAPPATTLENGSVVIAAITSCTNTSNPSVMVAAGLLAKKAVERGMKIAPHVKTSLAPGSRVVTDYLDGSELTPFLEKLGFYLVGYGCTTCIGNSGPLASPEVEAAVDKNGLSVVAVLSGNRNFEGRIHPLVKASSLASPPLVVAYALAGTIRKDLSREPLGRDRQGTPVYLRELWPSAEEVSRVVGEAIRPELFEREYAHIVEGDEHWQRMASPTGKLFDWDPNSTYVKEPPYFEEQDYRLEDIEEARALVVLGDSITTDHISPAGSIPPASPAGKYLIGNGVQPRDFNSYGSRRGNHEVMIRGTFANVRLRNQLAPDKEGYWTAHLPDGEVTTIYEAAVRYQEERVPLIVLAGKEYGSGSSRDWAAKGPRLLGVRAVIAESFERIHRSNLVAMGIVPLQFQPGESISSLGLTGKESFTIRGLREGLSVGKQMEVQASGGEGKTRSFKVTARLDNEVDLEYVRNGGVLPMVLRERLS